MAEGKPSDGSGLGFPEIRPSALAGEPDPLEDDYEERLAEASPQPQEQPAQPTEAQPPPQQAPVQAPEPPAQGEQSQEQQPGESADEHAQRLYAGRYQSIEDLEAGYRHIQGLQKRTAEKERATSQKAQQYEAWLRQAIPIVKQAQQQRQQLPPDDFGDGADFSDPAQLQQFVNQQVEQRLASERKNIRQEVVRGQTQQQTNQAIQSFAQAHNDIVGTEREEEVANVIRELQAPVTVENLETALELVNNPRLRQMVDDLYADPTDPNMLQAAKEAVQNPALAEIYLAQPDLTTTPHGQSWARKQASLPQMVTQAQAQAQGSVPNQEQMRRAAHVETGGTGVPVQGAPGQRPVADEMDEAIKEWRDGSSLFGFLGT